MKKILIKSGWLGRNGLAWYSSPDGLGTQVYELYDRLTSLGHKVYFQGDVGRKFVPDLEIHLDRQISSCRSSKKILIYTEPDFVQPQNIFFPLVRYEITLTPRSDIETSAKIRRYEYPRALTRGENPQFGARDILISCIAGNKNAVVKSQYNLYPERQRFIHILERELGSAFHLYGGGWEMIDHPVGFMAKVAFRSPALARMLRRRPPLRSYRGACDNKKDVMQRSLFTLCIENTSAPGSMTEKLIDCFQYGSVPLYLGSPDIEDMVPKELYYGLDKFSNETELVDFVRDFSQADYDSWIKDLDSSFDDVSKNRSVSRYVDTVISAVEDILGAQKKCA